MNKILLIPLLSLSIVGFVNASIQTYSVDGCVKNIDLIDNKITLSQNSVTELGWPKRNVTYDISSKQINNLKIGQHVSIRFTDDSIYHPIIRDLSIEG